MCIRDRAYAVIGTDNATACAVMMNDTAIISIDNGTYYYACLLYTSPSPRDRTRSRMPSSA